jgi:ABC-type transport system involved in multi-copper enzyme maturation permease subunit
MSEAQDKPAGTIYDLGYKRYVGTRRSQGTRWQVISRHVLSQSWKKWWRFKVWMVLAIITTIVVGAIMVTARSERLGDLRDAAPVTRLVDEIVFGSIGFFTTFAFLFSLTVAVRVVASDLRTGAFTFYFSRPVRTVDYVLGKVIGLFVLMATLILAPMLVITFVRLGLSENTDELVKNLAYVPKSLLVGTVGALTYTCLPLGFSALLRKPNLNLAIWAGYYIILTSIILGIAVYTKTPDLAAIDPGFALTSLSYQLFDVHKTGVEQPASLVASLIGLLGSSAIGVAIAYLRVDTAGHEGIGGGS